MSTCLRAMSKSQIHDRDNSAQPPGPNAHGATEAIECGWMHTRSAVLLRGQADAS
jgi:hypothetical protein